MVSRTARNVQHIFLGRRLAHKKWEMHRLKTRKEYKYAFRRSTKPSHSHMHSSIQWSANLNSPLCLFVALMKFKRVVRRHIHLNVQNNVALIEAGGAIIGKQWACGYRSSLEIRRGNYRHGRIFSLPNCIIHKRKQKRRRILWVNGNSKAKTSSRRELSKLMFTRHFNFQFLFIPSPGDSWLHCTIRVYMR